MVNFCPSLIQSFLRLVLQRPFFLQCENYQSFKHYGLFKANKGFISSPIASKYLSANCSNQKKEINPKKAVMNFSCIRKYSACGMPLLWAANYVAVIGMWFFSFLAIYLTNVYFTYDWQENGEVMLDSRKVSWVDGEGRVRSGTVTTTLDKDNVLFGMASSTSLLILYLSLYIGINKSDYNLVSRSCRGIAILQLSIMVAKGISVYNIIAGGKYTSDLPGLMESLIIFLFFPLSVWIVYCFKEEELKPKQKIGTVPPGEKGEVMVNEV